MLDKLSVRARVQALAISNFGTEGARRYMRVLDASLNRQENGRRQHLMLEAEGMFPRIDGVYDHDAYIRS